MSFFKNVINDDTYINSFFVESFDEFDKCVRHSIGQLSKCMESAAIYYYSKKDNSGRLKCCLYYALYNISINSSDADICLIDFFIKIIGSRICMPNKFFNCRFDDEECRSGLKLILGPSNVRKAFDILQQNRKLRERTTCPFKEYQKSSVSFLDFVGMTLNEGSWPAYDPMFKK